MSRTLFRSSQHRLFAGVAGGLAERWGLSAAFVRIAWVALSIITAGILAILYLILVLVLPAAPATVTSGEMAISPRTDALRQGFIYRAVVVAVALVVVTSAIMFALCVSGLYR